MADVRTFLRQVLAELERARASTTQAGARKKWLAAIDGYRKEWDAFIAPGFKDDATPINPQRAAYEIDRALPDDAILVSDIGVHHNWLLQFCKPKRPDSLIGSHGLRRRWASASPACSAPSSRRPTGRASSVCGDGAFFMHANVLGTAVEYNLPVVWVVWNNYAYASIRGLQRGYLGGRELATDFKHPDDRQALQSGLRRDGALGRRRGRAASTAPAISAMRCATAIAANKPYLIDANIGADKNPGGAGVWELPGLGVSAPVIGGRYTPG